MVSPDSRFTRSMQIGLVRHFQIPHRLSAWLDAEGFTRWIDWYDGAHGDATDAARERMRATGPWDACFSSHLPRAEVTAAALHDGAVRTTPLLREVPFAPATDRGVRLPVFLWQAASRAAWLAGHGSQPESRLETQARVGDALDLICHAHPDGRVLVVGHGFLMQMLARELHRRGFRGRVPLRPRGGTVYPFSRD